jgi:electron transport complex protein RnfG
MANKIKDFYRMVLTLLLVAFSASLALGYIYKVTEKPIAQAKLEKKLTAIKEVVPEFSNNPFEEATNVGIGKDTLTVYPAKQNGELVGMAVLTSTDKGFSGLIRLMAGFLPDGTIHNIVVVHHAETPGLGDKIEQGKSDFPNQFFGKDPSKFDMTVKKDGGEVDAITAATISSRAYCDAMRKAWECFQKVNNK